MHRGLFADRLVPAGSATGRLLGLTEVPPRASWAKYLHSMWTTRRVVDLGRKQSMMCSPHAD